MAKKLYSLTEEHRAQLTPWADRWIANAMSTKPMDDADREAMRVAIRGLYEAAGLTPPPDHRIVFVPSPYVLRLAAGFASAIWYLRKNRSASGGFVSMDAMAATDAVTDAVTHAMYAATDAATDAATRAVTDATDAATDAATRAVTDAMYAATDAATDAATHNGTDAATEAKWYRGMDWTIAIARRCLHPSVVPLGISCAAATWRLWNGGNQWSGWVSYISFFRHVVKLPLDYSKWQHYEAAAIHGGPRVMHEKFCMVSDRPVVLKVDDENRPHCEDGPFCRWSDGTSLYAWHGVRVPWTVIEHPESITVAQIEAESNDEVKRVMVERYGWDRWLVDIGAKPVSVDNVGALYRTSLGGADIGIAVVENSTVEADGTRKKYARLGRATHQTAHELIAASFGLTTETYRPIQES